MEEWRRLPKIGSYIGSIGAPIMSSLWDWTLTFRRSHSKTVSWCRTGYCGLRQQVKAGTVSTAIMAVGQKISVALGVDPTKVPGSDKRLTRLAQVMDGWSKEDPRNCRWRQMCQSYS